MNSDPASINHRVEKKVPLATKALLSNDLDVLLNVGATSAIVSAAQGAKVRAWLVPHPVTPYHFVARKDSGGTIRGLIGKTIAVFGIGAVSYHIPRIILERNGVDPEKVNYVVAGSNADRFRAMIGGKADAAMVSRSLVITWLGFFGTRSRR